MYLWLIGPGHYMTQYLSTSREPFQRASEGLSLRTTTLQGRFFHYCQVCMNGVIIFCL